MTDDHFRPPRAVVADVVEPAHLTRPRRVALACKLLWATIGLGLLSLIPGVRGDFWEGYAEAPVVMAIFTLVVVGLMTAIEAWLIWLVWNRQGWARWVLLLVLAFGWVMTFSDFSTTIEEGMAAVIIDLSTGIAEMFAAALLFLSQGRFWFARNGEKT